MVKSKLPVFTENQRAVSYLKKTKFGDIALVVVGAACVGSIELTKKPKKGEVEVSKEYFIYAT